MELNIHIFLKDKLKPEVELIYVMFDRSNLKLTRLQIYRADILQIKTNLSDRLIIPLAFHVNQREVRDLD